MLIMTVATTSNGMICTLDQGKVSLNFPYDGWLSRGNSLFKRFGRDHSRKVTKVRWGKEKMLQLPLGTDPTAAAEIIDRCFQTLWGHVGPYKLELRGFGWKTSTEQNAVREVS